MGFPRRYTLFAAAVAVLGATACGHKIGDSCSVSTDCASDGTRVCDQLSKDGYCTMVGCDFDTCPGNSICVRFFPGVENATSCTNGDDCNIDEICTVAGQCAPLSVEQRFCMATCGSDGDCRSGYECRDLSLEVKHGGEAVPDPTGQQPTPTDSYCAPRRPCTFDDDCATGETCDFGSKTCIPTSN